MARAISISVASDTKAFADGINKGVIEPLEDAQTALDDVAKAGDQAGEDLTKSFKDAQHQTEKNQDEYDKLSRVIKETGRTGRQAGDDMKDGLHGGREGLSEFKDEATQTAKETAASFDGSAQSITDAFQEVAANALSGFGPAGAVAGIALAAGIGLATSAIAQTEEEAKKAKERIGELATAIIDGSAGYEGLKLVVDKLKEMATVSDGSVKSLEDIKAQAEKLGVTFEELANTYAGGTDNLEEQIAAIDNLRTQQLDALNPDTRGYQNAVQAVNDKYDSQIEKLQSVQEETQKAADEAALYAESGAARMAEKQTAIEQINSAYDDSVGAVSDYVNAETGVLDVQAYLDAINARRDALNDYQKNLGTSGLSDEQKSALNDMGLESASIWLEAYNSSTTSPGQKKEMADALTIAASDASGVAKNAIDDAFKKPTEHTVKVNADLSEADSAIDGWARNQRVRVNVDLVDRNGQVIY